MTWSSVRASRRAVLAGTTGLGAALTAPTAAAHSPLPRRMGATMRWLGTSGWRLDLDGHTLLVDPYLTRFPTGLAAGSFNPDTPLQVDPAACQAAGSPRTILVTHTHWDHFNDVPYLAQTHHARVFGTLTTYHLAQAMGTPSTLLSTVNGGEQLDLGEYVVRVVPGLHSRSGSYSVLFPGIQTTTPPAPSTIADLPEGDTLCFQVEIPDGRRVFFMGASDFIDNALVGLEPEVAAIVVPSTDATHDYLPRLLDGLDRPRVVIPVHWDDFESPLTNPPKTNAEMRRRLDQFTADVRRLAPRTRVVVPRYGEPLDLG